MVTSVFLFYLGRVVLYTVFMICPPPPNPDQNPGQTYGQKPGQNLAKQIAGILLTGGEYVAM